MQRNHPLKRHSRLSVAIPASLVSDVPHLREKTLKIGLIGRALAIFRVDEVIVFPDRLDRDQKKDASLIGTLLSYMETPQYLRKPLFRIRPELRYVGVLPPLRTPHHPLQNRKKDLKIGEFREGIVTSADEKGIRVDVGVEHPIHVPNVQIPANMRVTVRIAEIGRDPIGELATPERIEEYWGYKVTISEMPLGHMLKERHFDLVIATSRLGKPVTKVAADLSAKWEKSRHIIIAFGSPTDGLMGIVRQEELRLEELADFVVNMIPHQATATVRTEEALYATLAALSLFTTKE